MVGGAFKFSESPAASSSGRHRTIIAHGASDSCYAISGISSSPAIKASQTVLRNCGQTVVLEGNIVRHRADLEHALATLHMFDSTTTGQPLRPKASARRSCVNCLTARCPAEWPNCAHAMPIFVVTEPLPCQTHLYHPAKCRSYCLCLLQRAGNVSHGMASF
jgi:hypothetical protein